MAALPNPPSVPLEEYLNTAYDPDVEYVDGLLVERKMGDWLHSLVQSNIIFALRRKYPHLKVVPELRSSTTNTRFRLPDVTVLLDAPKTRFLQEPAFVAIEILSLDDSMGETLDKLAEYENKGVRYIWLIDPHHRRMYAYREGSLFASAGLECADPRIELQAEEVFAG
jgi:Uma2 family endonuclease